MGVPKVRMAVDPGQFGSDASRRQCEIDTAGCDGAHGHARMLGRLCVLCERDAALRLDGFQSLRAVRSSAGEDDTDGAALKAIGQRLKEVVDREIPDRALAPGRKGQDAL